MFLSSQGCSLGNLELQSHRQNTLATSLARDPEKQRNEKKDPSVRGRCPQRFFVGSTFMLKVHKRLGAFPRKQDCNKPETKEITPNHNNRMATPSKTISGQNHPGRAITLRSRSRLLTIGKTRATQVAKAGNAPCTHEGAARDMKKTIASGTHTHTRHSKYMESAAQSHARMHLRQKGSKMHAPERCGTLKAQNC